MTVKEYLVITDIEKVFDSLDHTFLISTLKKKYAAYADDSTFFLKYKNLIK